MFGLDDLNPIRIVRNVAKEIDPIRAVTGEPTRIPVVSPILDVAENATDSVLKDVEGIVTGEGAEWPESQRG